MCNEGPGKELGEMRGEGRGANAPSALPGPRALDRLAGWRKGWGQGERGKTRGRGPFLGAPEGHSLTPDFHNPSGLPVPNF